MNKISHNKGPGLADATNECADVRICTVSSMNA